MTATEIVARIEERGAKLVPKDGGGFTILGASRLTPQLLAELRAQRDAVLSEWLLGEKGAAAAPVPPTEPRPERRPGLRLSDDLVLAREVRRLAALWRATGLDEPTALSTAVAQVTGTDKLPLFCDYPGCGSLDGSPGIVARYSPNGEPYCATHLGWAGSA